MKYILNGENMRSREEAHAELARVLDFPAYYGRNLDALWDMVSAAEAEIVLVNPAPMLNGLGVYGCKLLETLFEAAAENKKLRFEVDR